MADSRLYEKLEKVNSEKEKVVFKLEYKGKVTHETTIELPDYAKQVIDDKDLSLFYFFKDLANKLEEKINEVHKKKMWDEGLNKGKKDGATDKDK